MKIEKNKNMKKIFTSLFLTTLFLVGCGGNGSKNDSLNADTTDIVADAAQDSIRHTNL